jgi:hypothetical protein
MVLCDAVHKDLATGKSTILGTFGSFMSIKFPAKIQLSVFFALTDGIGEHELKLRIVDSSDIANNNEDPVFESSLPIDFKQEPLAVIEGYFRITGEFPKHGVFHCELLVDEIVLMSRRLIAIQVELPPTGDVPT